MRLAVRPNLESVPWLRAHTSTRWFWSTHQSARRKRELELLTCISSSAGTWDTTRTTWSSPGLNLSLAKWTSAVRRSRIKQSAIALGCRRMAKTGCQEASGPRSASTIAIAAARVCRSDYLPDVPSVTFSRATKSGRLQAFLVSGGGGNRTRVRGRTGKSIYKRSPGFRFARRSVPRRHTRRASHPLSVAPRAIGSPLAPSPTLAPHSPPRAERGATSPVLRVT